MLILIINNTVLDIDHRGIDPYEYYHPDVASKFIAIADNTEIKIGDAYPIEGD